MVNLSPAWYHIIFQSGTRCNKKFMIIYFKDVVLTFIHVLHVIVCLTHQLHWMHCSSCALQCCHNESHGVSNHRHPDCLLIRLFRRISKKTSQLRVIGGFPSQGPVTFQHPQIDHICWTIFLLFCVSHNRYRHTVYQSCLCDLGTRSLFQGLWSQRSN